MGGVWGGIPLINTYTSETGEMRRKRGVFLGLQTIIVFTIAVSMASVLEIEKTDHSSRLSCAYLMAVFPVSLP